MRPPASGPGALSLMIVSTSGEGSVYGQTSDALQLIGGVSHVTQNLLLREM